MKRLTFIFLIFLSLLFNMIVSTSVAEAKDFREGFYKVEDLNLSPNNTYTVQNNSFSDRAYVLIFDSNQVMQQSIRLKAQSSKFDLVPIQPGYRIVIFGTNGVSIS